MEDGPGQAAEHIRYASTRTCQELEVNGKSCRHEAGIPADYVERFQNWGAPPDGMAEASATYD